MKTSIIHGILFVIIIITLGFTKSKADNCWEYRLSGGSRNYEGVLEVRYKGNWVNACFDGIKEENISQICLRTTSNSVSLIGQKYSENVFRARLQPQRISYNACSTKDDDPYSQCERVFSVCCYDVADDPCSDRWANTVWSQEYKRGRKKKKEKQIGFREFLDKKFSNSSNFTKAWTNSFLKDSNIQCETQSTNTSTYNGSYICQTTCNVTSDPVFVMLSSNNRPCCVSREEYQNLQTNNCSVTELAIVEADETSGKGTASPKCCIAAEVKDGKKFVSVEDCSRFLISFNVSNKNESTTVAPITKNKGQNINESSDENKKESTGLSSTRNIIRSTTNTTESATSNGSDTSDSLNMIIFVVIASVLVAVCIVFGVVLYRMFKNIKKVHEKPRPNSVANHAYALQVLHQQQSVDDEEYTLISDMELEHNSAGQFKPKLPDRDGEITTSKDEHSKEMELITIADYSVPSDNIRDGYKISQTSVDYCTTTYDDPIRLKLKEEIKNNEKKSCRDTDGSELETNESGRNEGHSERPSCNNNNVHTHRDSTTAENESGANAGFMSTGREVNQGQPVMSLKRKEYDDAYEDGFGPLKQNQIAGEVLNDGNTECVVEDSRNNCDDIDGNDDADYEDPGVIDGKYQNKCSSNKLFEEHVCLSCLKPEHLTKLGIKIITDDIYEKSKNFQRCLSEPLSKSSCNSMDVDDSCSTEMNQNKNIKRKDNAIDEQEDRLHDLHVTRRNKIVSDVKRCSVCNTVYDRLGNVEPNVWTKLTDNIYDQFGNFKNFKHRNQVGGKRINSN